MGRSLSPILRKELANLDKDADSRKSAMKALKSYVKDLDSRAIPQFLAQVSETTNLFTQKKVSETKETGSATCEYTISLYEVLARTHGVNIVSQIGCIMATIVKTLNSSAGSFALHQACSKVVPAIARYGIEPTTPEDKKRHIIHSLCKPLSDSLLASQESLSSGAALCLKALVDCDNWRYASHEMVNEVCLRAAGALEEKSIQPNSHMGLIMSLAKHNSLIVEAYARLLINSGLRILDAGIVEANSQKKLAAIQMVNFLMKCLDARSIYSELESIIKKLEECQVDQMAYVKGAAFEALQTARGIDTEKGSKFEHQGSFSGSNFGRVEHNQRRSCWNHVERSSLSPESQTLNSFAEYDSFVESPISTSHVSLGSNNGCRSVNRKLWRDESGGQDISLKDGLFLGLNQGNPSCNLYSEDSEQYENSSHGTEEFAGFFLKSPRDSIFESSALSPQASDSHMTMDNIEMFATPRKLIHSLQEPSIQDDWVQQACKVIDEKEKLLGNVERFQGESESVSSTEDAPVNDLVLTNHVVVSASRKSTGSPRILFSLFFLVLFALSFLVLVDNQGEGDNLLPT